MQKISIEELRNQQGHFSPIYIDNLEEAFQAHPDIPFSEVKLSASDRLVYESCSYSGGKILAPHENTVSIPWFLTSEYIQKKLGCEINIAVELADEFSILECTSSMVIKMLDWAKKRSPEQLRDYLYKFILAIAEVESNLEDDEESDLSDVPNFNPIAYHVMGEDLYQEDWFESHPKANMVINQINNSDDIKSIGKKLYQKEYNLTSQEYGVVWTDYNIRKKELEQKINLTKSAKVLIKKIKEHTITGSVLYKIQQKQIKMVNSPNEEDWTLIWQNYKASQN